MLCSFKKILKIIVFAFIGALPTLGAGPVKIEPFSRQMRCSQNLLELENWKNSLEFDQETQQLVLSQEAFEAIQKYATDAADLIQDIHHEGMEAAQGEATAEAQVLIQILLNLNRLFNLLEPLLHERDVRHMIYEVFDFNQEEIPFMEALGANYVLNDQHPINAIEMTYAEFLRRYNRECAVRSYNLFSTIKTCAGIGTFMLFSIFEFGIFTDSSYYQEPAPRSGAVLFFAILMALVSLRMGTLAEEKYAEIPRPEPLRFHENYNAENANRAMLTFAFFRTLHPEGDRNPILMFDQHPQPPATTRTDLDSLDDDLHILSVLFADLNHPMELTPQSIEALLAALRKMGLRRIHQDYKARLKMG
jgi:hypothetical protein